MMKEPQENVGIGVSSESSPENSEKVDFYTFERIMAADEIRKSTEKLKTDFIEQMEVKLSAVINDVVHTMQKAEAIDKYEKGSQNMNNSRGRKVSVTGKLPEKVFVSRPSPLTELLQVTHFKTIHHIFIATLILIALHAVVLDLMEQNTVDLGLVRLMWAFGRPQMTLSILLSLEFCALALVYPAFHFWYHFREQVKPEMTKMIDYMAAASFLVFLSGMMCVPAIILWRNPLPPASGATVTMEQCRLLMKIYAFVRSNVPRVIQRKNHVSSKSENGFSGFTKEKLHEEPAKVSVPGESEDSFQSNITGSQEEQAEDVASRVAVSQSSSSSVLHRRRFSDHNHGEKSEQVKKCNGSGSDFRRDNNNVREEEMSSGELNLRHLRNNADDAKESSSCCPSYSKYLYFYVAPTLIYKDNYPRTSYVRWDYVCWNFAQVVGCIVVMYHHLHAIINCVITFDVQILGDACFSRTFKVKNFLHIV